MVQKIWASIFGAASVVIGILKYISLVNIPVMDAFIHIFTGSLFIGGAWLYEGKYVSGVNFWLGIFYIAFGVIDQNIPHVIAGAASLMISLIFKPRLNMNKTQTG